MISIVNVADIVEPNGKTWRENNLAKNHDIALGTLVELIPSDYEEKGGVRLFVVNHSRDCDGTPLYDMSHDPAAYVKFLEFEASCANGDFEKEPYGHGLKMIYKGVYQGMIVRHYSRDSLKVIQPPILN